MNQQGSQSEIGSNPTTVSVVFVSREEVASRIARINTKMRASRFRELTEAERERKELQAKFGVE